MNDNEQIIRDLMYSYADIGIITIPVNKKKPAINMNWNDLPVMDAYERIDLMFKTKFLEVTGLAVLITKENPNLACVDIDCEDSDTINKILIAVPSHVNKRGRKGCSFFFQQEGSDGLLKFSCKAGGYVEIFYSNKYVVIPPSFHSMEDLKAHQYFWIDEGCTLLSVKGIDGLPIINREHIDNLELLCGGSSIEKVNKNSPIQVQYDSNGIADGRYDAIGKVIGSYVKRKNGIINISEVVELVLKFDSENFNKNSFFDYRFNKKHKEIKQNVSIALNALSYVQAMLISIEKREKLSFIETKSNLEEVHEMPNDQFRPFIEFKKSEEFSGKITEEMIPPLYRKFTIALADSVGTDLQSVLFPLLGATAGVLQSKFIIRPIKKSTFFQRPNLGMVLVAKSGSKKSDILKAVMWKNRQLDHELLDVNPREVLEEQHGLNERIKSQNKAKDKAYSDGRSDDAASIRDEIYSLQDQLNALEKKIKPTIWLYHSATVQKIIHDHSKNHRNGLFFIADEFNTYLALMYKKGNEEMRSYMMECLNGDSSYTSKTLSRDTDHIEECYGSFLTTLQPDVLKCKIDDIHNPRTPENDGFWQRFTFIIMGKPTMDRKGIFNPLDFKKEYDLFEHGFMCKQREVNIADSALEYYDYVLRETELRAMEQSNDKLGSFLAKHQGKLCKYALFAEWWLTEGRVISIGKEAIRYAKMWLDFEFENISHIFSIGRNDDDYIAVMRIIERIESGMLVDGETASKWQFECRGIFRSMDQFARYLKILENHGYISLIEVKSNSKIVKINPKMRSYAK